MPTSPSLDDLEIAVNPALLAELRAALERKAAREKHEAIRRLSLRPWNHIARPKQLPPHHPRHHLADEHGYACGCEGIDTSYEVFLMCAGRGLGKTMAGANNIVVDALAGCTVNPGGACRDCPHVFAVIAPRREHIKEVCFEGSSGILNAIEEGELENYNKSSLIISLKNGAKIQGFSAENEEKFRGPNFSGCWVDELGSFRYESVWHNMRLALRIGQHPRIYVTTTPRPTPLIKQLFKDALVGKVHVTTGSTDENRANLSTVMVESLYGKYGGTRLGRQELSGELLEDIPGALWVRKWLDDDRVGFPPETQTRCVVAIDPAVTSGEDSDETGIIVAAQGDDGHGYVLADLSMRDTPYNCCKRAVDAWYEFKADAIVAEQNNGGDFIRDLVRTVDPNVPYRQVYATRGKATRAQPISSLYEQHKIHHVGTWPELEDQMCTWLPDDPNSPDRVDALVWAVFWLRGLYEGSVSAAFGFGYCPHCGQMVRMENLDSCLKCGKSFAAAA
jgi:phage terminase large subunit-like protein